MYETILKQAVHSSDFHLDDGTLCKTYSCEFQAVAKHVHQYSSNASLFALE